MLKLESVGVSYGPIKAVRGVSLEVAPGSIVSVLGANGAGKSSLLNAVAGLTGHTGSITLDGKRLPSEPHLVLRQGVALVPEGRRVFPHLTVAENLIMGGFTSSKEQVRAGLEQAYTLFPRLKEREGQLAGTLSGGEQQMLAVGRALMTSPRYLLLDEPSLGLSPLLAQEIWKQLRVINQAGTGVVLVEQNARAALRLAHTAYILQHGELVRSGSGADLLSDQSVQSAYLGAAN
jgi:branched-chain amino acid transport system ATP-binding protein